MQSHLKTIRMPDTVLSLAAEKMKPVFLYAAVAATATTVAAADVHMCDLWETSTQCWKTLKLP